MARIEDLMIEKRMAAAVTVSPDIGNQTNHDMKMAPAVTISPSSRICEPRPWWERDVIAVTVSPPALIGSKPVGPEKVK